MSFNKVITSVFFSAILIAQMPPFAGQLTFTGEIQSSAPAPLNTLYVELYDPRSHQVVERTSVSGDGSFRLYQGTAGSSYTIRVVTAPGEDPLLEQYHQMVPGDSIVLRLPEQKRNKPISGTVSVRELQHPVSKQAVRATLDAERYSQAGETSKAIAKLEQATRIAPSFRDAHANLGVQYARAGRIAEALRQFHVALEIGPPNARICSNLSLAYLALGHFRDGEVFARKALELEPDNVQAKKLLQYAVAH